MGISIDGPEAMHDAYRVDKQARPTYGRVRAGLDRLVAAGVDWNVLCTVHAANQDAPLEVYRHFRDELGARYIQFIPIVERVEDGEHRADGPVRRLGGVGPVPRRGLRRVGPA